MKLICPTLALCCLIIFDGIFSNPDNETLLRVKRGSKHFNKPLTKRQQARIEANTQSKRNNQNVALNNNNYRIATFEPNPKHILIQPNYPGNIKVGGVEQQKALTNFKNSLIDAHKKANTYKELPTRSQEARRNHAGGSQPIFQRNGKNGDKNTQDEFMVGALDVSFKNPGVTPLKILGVSGGQLNTRETHTRDQYDNGQPGKLTPMNYKDLSTGYQFANVHPSKDKKIMNVLTGTQTNEKCTTNRAAQKLMSTLGEHMKENPTHKVKDVSMIEQWLKVPGSRAVNRNWHKTQPVESCASCKKTLPKFFGQKK